MLARMYFEFRNSDRLLLPLMLTKFTMAQTEQERLKRFFMSCENAQSSETASNKGY